MTRGVNWAVRPCTSVFRNAIYLLIDVKCSIIYFKYAMKVLTLGDELLRQKSEPVDEVTPEIKALAEDMFTTMIQKEGVGLAAPQVGILKRMFVLIADDDVRRVFINPQIIATSTELSEYEEGCLSIPRVSEKITRPVRVTVQALNENGKPFTLEADGLLARIIQHEYDHLEGVLYIDRGDPFFKFKTEESFKKRAEKRQQKEAARAAKEARIAAKKAAKQ